MISRMTSHFAQKAADSCALVARGLARGIMSVTQSDIRVGPEACRYPSPRGRSLWSLERSPLFFRISHDKNATQRVACPTFLMRNAAKCVILLSSESLYKEANYDGRQSSASSCTFGLRFGVRLRNARSVFPLKLQSDRYADALTRNPVFVNYGKRPRGHAVGRFFVCPKQRRTAHVQ